MSRTLERRRVTGFGGQRAEKASVTAGCAVRLSAALGRMENRLNLADA